MFPYQGFNFTGYQCVKWPYIRLVYLVLPCYISQNFQWKVRRTLAFSIHELALIVGEEITHEDLVPVFDGFLKDLDEVRVGVLKHFSDFLRVSYVTLPLGANSYSVCPCLFLISVKCSVFV